MLSPSTSLQSFSDDLIGQLILLEVLEPDQAEPVREIARKTGADSEETLVGLLVKQGLLTSYQAELVRAGQADRLPVGPYLLLEPMEDLPDSSYRAVRRLDRKPFTVHVLPPGGRWNLLTAADQAAVLTIKTPHPAVVPLVEVGDEAGESYLVWPQVEGELAQQYVETHGPLDPARAMQLAAQVADALADMHRRGIAHGLVCPATVLMTPDGNARLTGLGIGAVRAENAADTRLPEAWLEWAAPEVHAAPSRLTHAGDAFGVGCLLFWLLTTAVPNLGTRSVRLKALLPSIPDAVADLVQRLLRRDPTARPSDLAAIRAELHALSEIQRDSELITLSQAKLDAEPPALPPNLPPSRFAGLEGGVADRGAPGAGLEGDASRPAVDLPEKPVRQSFWKRVSRSVMPWAPPEPIQVSVYGTRELLHGETNVILAVAHRPEMFHQLQSLTARCLPGCSLLAACHTTEPVPKGGEVWLHVEVDGIGAVISPPLIKFPWSLESNVSHFNVSLPSWTRAAGAVVGRLVVGLNGYEVAQLQFDLVVRSPSAPT